MSPLEKAARALCAYHFNMCGNDAEDEDRVVSRRWNMFVPQARHAISAIREPDEATVEAMLQAWDRSASGSFDRIVTEIFTAAIDQLLSSEQPK